MKDKLKGLTRNPYFLITIVYFLSQFFVLIISGCWWDDWTFISHNVGYVKAVAEQSGRPEWFYLVQLCWSLKNNGRILIFFLYFLDAIFVYSILKDSKLFNEISSLIITLIFIVIPCNDARILISNFQYDVGLFLFFFSFFLFVKWNNLENSKRKKIVRIFILISFYFSFILNSLLVYFYIIIAYVFVLDLKANSNKNIIKKIYVSIKNTIIKYLDFIIIPFIYYIVNKLLFPTSGEVFSNYNAVTIEKAIKCIVYTPLSMISVYIETIKNMLLGNSVMAYVILAIIALCIARELVNRRKNGLNSEAIIYFIYGTVILLLGLFPYVMVRSELIEIVGVQSRDSILIPLGIALIFFSIIEFLNVKRRNLLVALILLLGIFGTNRLYIGWQKDYYHQLSLENLLNQDIIKNNDTFFLANTNETFINGERYYSLNANAKNVFGSETRLFLCHGRDVKILSSNEEIKKTREKLSYAYIMKDYYPSDNNIDAVIIYNCQLSNLEVIKFKYYELTHYEHFKQLINTKGEIEIIEVDDDFTPLLIKEYDNDSLKTDEAVLNLLGEYMNE